MRKQEKSRSSTFIESAGKAYLCDSYRFVLIIQVLYSNLSFQRYPRLCFSLIIDHIYIYICTDIERGRDRHLRVILYWF